MNYNDWPTYNERKNSASREEMEEGKRYKEEVENKTAMAEIKKIFNVLVDQSIELDENNPKYTTGIKGTDFKKVAIAIYNELNKSR